MSDDLRQHYEHYPYPRYPLVASIRREDTYALNLESLWKRFHRRAAPSDSRRILVAGCGSFSPYVFSLSNPECEITGLDLSRQSLQRARLHCLLHGRHSVRFLTGDLLDPAVANGPFDLIDAYGVIHHLHDPLAGLRALAARLSEGGILRLMVYSRYARRQEESIRRAFRLLKITTLPQIREIIARAHPDSRLRRFADSSWEATFNEGIADALLHPRVVTYRIDDLLELISGAALRPLMFAHSDSREVPYEEIERVRSMEATRTAPGNFVLYLGRVHDQFAQQETVITHLQLNPCLRSAVSPVRFGTAHIPPRLGIDNPPLDRRTRHELRAFITPRPVSAAAGIPVDRLAFYKRALFLLEFTP